MRLYGPNKAIREGRNYPMPVLEVVDGNSGEIRHMGSPRWLAEPKSEGDGKLRQRRHRRYQAEQPKAKPTDQVGFSVRIRRQDHGSTTRVSTCHTLVRGRYYTAFTFKNLHSHMILQMALCGINNRFYLIQGSILNHASYSVRRCWR